MDASSDLSAFQGPVSVAAVQIFFCCFRACKKRVVNDRIPINDFFDSLSLGWKERTTQMSFQGPGMVDWEICVCIPNELARDLNTIHTNIYLFFFL